jgi:hypothetical protein
MKTQLSKPVREKASFTKEYEQLGIRPPLLYRWASLERQPDHVEHKSRRSVEELEAENRHLRAENAKLPLVSAALRMALSQRRPPTSLILHSDRGSQFASAAYRQLLAKHGLIASMSRPGNCYDNAMSVPFGWKRSCLERRSSLR